MDGLSPDAPGLLVAGKYRLTRLIGRGGMGAVWEGVHVCLGTRVAIKFIESEHAQGREIRRRFENEARAAAALQSKHVVTVYDYGVMPDGRPYIVMEYLVGETLDQRLERVGRISPAETVAVVDQVCRALGRAHHAGIVHRDLKPENIFLVRDEDDPSELVKVLDFGIAKFTHETPGLLPSSSTRTGTLLGTPYYMSPEQARGLRTVDHRSDLWAVGVIAYRCLVGRLPFEGETVGDLLVKLCTFPLPTPSAEAPWVPPGFDAWFARALERNPERRFQSAVELSEALAQALGCALPARSARLGTDGSGSREQPVLARAGTGPEPGTTGVLFVRTGSGARSRRNVPLALLISGPLVVGALGVTGWLAVRGSPGMPAARALASGATFPSSFLAGSSSTVGADAGSEVMRPEAGLLPPVTVPSSVRARSGGTRGLPARSSRSPLPASSVMRVPRPRVDVGY